MDTIYVQIPSVDPGFFSTQNWPALLACVVAIIAVIVSSLWNKRLMRAADERGEKQLSTALEMTRKQLEVSTRIQWVSSFRRCVSQFVSTYDEESLQSQSDVRLKPDQGRRLLVETKTILFHLDLLRPSHKEFADMLLQLAGLCDETAGEEKTAIGSSDLTRAAHDIIDEMRDIDGVMY